MNTRTARLPMRVRKSKGVSSGLQDYGCEWLSWLSWFWSLVLESATYACLYSFSWCWKVPPRHYFCAIMFSNLQDECCLPQIHDDACCRFGSSTTWWKKMHSLHLPGLLIQLVIAPMHVFLATIIVMSFKNLKESESVSCLSRQSLTPEGRRGSSDKPLFTGAEIVPS